MKEYTEMNNSAASKGKLNCLPSDRVYSAVYTVETISPEKGNTGIARATRSAVGFLCVYVCARVLSFSGTYRSRKFVFATNAPGQAALAPNIWDSI